MKKRGHALRRRYGRTHASIGRGWRHIEAHHRYAIVGSLPKSGGGYLRERHVLGRGRDAHEALVSLYTLKHSPGGRWGNIAVLDMHAGRGKLAPTVSVNELETRKARGE